METIKSLKNISFNSLHLAFKEAFKDYEMQVNKKELQIMMHRRGFVPELSFGAFINDKIVSFTFNGVGSFNGIKTAYDTGTGTLKEYRGQGLATKIFNYSIPFLKKAKISQYLLEVLQHNPKAVSVYKNIGFEVSREFNYFVQEMKGISKSNKILDSAYTIKQIDLTEKESMKKFWDFLPSWQNSFEAIERRLDDFKILGAFKNQKLIGYCIFESVSGDITHLSVAKKERRNGVASALLTHVLDQNHHNSVKIINTEINCESITAFLKSFSIPVKGKQFEMIKQL